MSEQADGEVYRHPKPDKLGEIDLDAHAVIEASAGTGKTYTLEHLIIDVVLETGTPIDQILVVTFTRRATAEMTERVRQRFRDLIERAEAAGVSGVPARASGGGGGQGALFGEETGDAVEANDGPIWRIDADGLRRLKRAYHEFGRAPIHTIHSFCQRILKEYAFSNRRLFEEEHVDDRRLFDEVFYEALRADMSTDPDLQPWLAGYLQVVGGDVESLADDLYSDHASRSESRPRAESDGERREMMEALRALTETAGDEEPDLSLDEEVLEVEARRALLEAVERRLVERKQREGLYSFDDMLDLVWENLESDRGGELAEAIRERFRYALVDEFQDTDPIQWKIFRTIFLGGRDNHLFVIGDPKQAIYGFRGADVDTYQDAAEVVASSGRLVTLNTNYRSTAELIGAYNEIFSDEAAEPFFSGERFSYDEPVDCGVEERRLETDDGATASAIRVMEPEGAPEWNTDGIRRTLREGIADEIGAIVGGSRPLFLQSSEDTDEADASAPERERLGPSDIFVLTDSKRRGEEIGEALDRREIPHAFYRKQGLFRTEEATAIRDVLRGVARPGRRAWRLQAYMTPFFELSLGELERADEIEGPRAPRRMLDEWHALSEAGRFDRLFDRMIDESGVARRLLLFEQSQRKLTNLQHIFEVLAEEAHRGEHDAGSLAARLTAFIDGRAEPEGEDTDLQRLESDEEAVQIMTIHKSKGLQAPVVFLYGGLNRPGGAGKTFKVEESDGTHTKVRYTSRGAMTRKEKQRGDAYFMSESRRQMYVAITRAVGRVYLPYLDETVESGCAYGSMKGSYLPVNRRLRDLVGRLDEFPAPWFERQPVKYREPRAADASDANEGRDWEGWSLPDWLRADPTDSAYFDQLKQGRFRTITSFTAMQSDGGGAERSGGRGRAADPSIEGGGGASSGVVDREESAGAPGGSPTPAAAEMDGGEAESERVPGGLRTGLLVHSLLEEIDRSVVREATGFDGWRNQPSVAETVDRLWRQYQLDPEHREAVERMVWRGMRQPMEVLGEVSMSAVDSMQREVTFYFPIPEEDHPPLGRWRDERYRDSGAPDVQDGYITGEIDVLFEHHGEIWVADWKTNVAESYGSDRLRRLVAEQYALQVKLYAIAAVKMLGISDEETYRERFGGVLYLFVRGMSERAEPADESRQGGVAEVTPDWEELVAYARRLGDDAVEEMS